MSKITIRDQPWYGEEPDSPALPQDGFALVMSVVPARSRTGPTSALLGGYRVPGHLVRVYNELITGAIEIVGVDGSTGYVYHNNAEEDGGEAEPVTVNLNPPPPAPGVLPSSARSAHFNVDLREQLHLPAEKGNYHIFLWLEELTSPVEEIELPGPAPKSPPPPPPERADDGLLAFKESYESPRARGKQVVLALPHPQEKPSNDTPVMIYGAVGPGCIPTNPPRKGEPRKTITVLGICHQSRDFRWQSTPLPVEVIEQKTCSFEFDLLRLLKGAKRPQKVFVIAMCGGAKSEVLVVDAS